MPGETDDLQTVVLDPRGDILLNIGSNESEDSRPQKTLRACSRALARVSPVFDRMLYGSFAESKRPSDGLWTIDLPEDDPAAFELMARIAHGLVHDAPESLSIDQFYELTTLTHYYDCSHILTPWAGHWINVVLDGPDDMPFWAHKMLWISWELRDRRIFEATARNILMETPCSLSDRDSAVHDLQMPPDIIENIHKLQYRTITILLSPFRELLSLLVVVDEKPRWCRHASYLGPHRCESMILGSMTFCLTRAGLWPLPKSAADVDISIRELHSLLANLVIHDIGQAEKRSGDHAECNPKVFLRERMQRTLADMGSPVSEMHVEHFEARGGMGVRRDGASGRAGHNAVGTESGVEGERPAS